MGGTAVAANMALANTEWSMPDGTVVKRHPDLFILATANTLGQGKGRSPYGSAEVLDGATLNRFAGVSSIGVMTEPLSVNSSEMIQSLPSSMTYGQKPIQQVCMVGLLALVAC